MPSPCQIWAAQLAAACTAARGCRAIRLLARWHASAHWTAAFMKRWMACSTCMVLRQLVQTCEVQYASPRVKRPCGSCCSYLESCSLLHGRAPGSGSPRAEPLRVAMEAKTTLTSATQSMSLVPWGRPSFPVCGNCAAWWEVAGAGACQVRAYQLFPNSHW